MLGVAGKLVLGLCLVLACDLRNVFAADGGYEEAKMM